MNQVLRICTKGFILFILAFPAGRCGAQWLPERCLSGGPQNALTTGRSGRGFVADGNVLHAAYGDKVAGCYQTYYHRSMDGGLNWEDPVLLCDGEECYAAYPTVAIEGRDVYVAWYREEGTDMDLYFRRSTDGGTTWEEKDTLTCDAFLNRQACLVAHGDMVHLVWCRQQSLDDKRCDIFYKRSTDRGKTWEHERKISSAARGSSGPALAVTGRQLHLAWYNKSSYYMQVFYAASWDEGENWSAERQLVAGAGFALCPSIVAEGSRIHVAYENFVDNFMEVWLKSSTDGGATWWEGRPVIAIDRVHVFAPVLAMSGTRLHLAFVDNRAGVSQAFYQQSTDDGWSWGYEQLLSIGEGISYNPVVCVSGAGVHAMWTEVVSGQQNIYYRGNLTGNITGVRRSTDASAEDFQLLPNYPNPATTSTTLVYELSRTADVRLTVYDLLGREVRVLVDMPMQPGLKTVVWDGRDALGNRQASGVYFCRMQVGNSVATRTLLLVDGN
jgi:hypothetical protein